MTPAYLEAVLDDERKPYLIEKLIGTRVLEYVVGTHHKDYFLRFTVKTEEGGIISGKIEDFFKGKPVHIVLQHVNCTSLTEYEDRYWRTEMRFQNEVYLLKARQIEYDEEGEIVEGTENEIVIGPKSSRKKKTRKNQARNKPK